MYSKINSINTSRRSSARADGRAHACAHTHTSDLKTEASPDHETHTTKHLNDSNNSFIPAPIF